MMCDTCGCGIPAGPFGPDNQDEPDSDAIELPAPNLSPEPVTDAEG